MKITCPYCHVSGEVEDSCAGRRVKCPKCNGSFKVSPPERDTPDLTEGVETVSVSCPHCKTVGDVDSSFLGQKVSCPQCHWIFVAESGEAPADIPETPLEEFKLSTSLEEFPAAEELPTGAESFPAVERLDEALLTESVPTEDHDAEILSAALPGHGQENEFVASAADRAAKGDRIFAEEPKEAEVDDRWTITWALGRAWQRTRGAKLVFFLQGLVFGLCMFLFNSITAGLVATSGVDVEALNSAAAPADFHMSSLSVLGLVLFSFISAMVGTALFGGMVYTGIRRAEGGSVSFSMLGRGFKNVLQLFLAVLVITVLSGIGYTFFVLPGLYLSVAWSMTLPLLVDQRLGIWEAMETSRKMVTRHWFKIFILMMIIMPVLVGVSAIPFGIGLIWTIPMSFILTGVIYQALYGERVLR